MKTLAILLLTLGFLTLSGAVRAQDDKVREDIDKDISLGEAVRRANQQFPDAQPLTEEEVVAAVRAIKVTHSDLKEDVYRKYMRVVNERVLPKDMYFSRLTAWNTPAGLFSVDWKVLTLRGRLATAEEGKALTDQYGGHGIRIGGPIRVDGFDYRIRTRFVSSGTPANTAERENALKTERNTSTGQTQRAPKEERVDQMYGSGTSDRGIYCVRWAQALANYAREHKGQFPIRLREAAGYLGDDEIAFRTSLTRDQFEILFQGHANDLGDPDKTPVITEKKPSQTEEGIWTRFYGYANGLAKIQTSADGTFGEMENSQKPNAKKQ